MALRDYLPWNRKKEPVPVVDDRTRGARVAEDVGKIVQDIKLAIGQAEPNKPSARVVKMERRAANPAIGYNVVSTPLGSRNNNFRGPFHDLSEIARAVDTESLLARSIQKHRELILKEGYDLRGKDKDTIKYIKDRLREFEWVTDVTTEQWVRDLATNIVTFSTAFMVLRRDPLKSSGNVIRRHGKRLDPIAGIFPMDPVSVLVEQNLHGRPTRWKQDIEGHIKIHDSDDVIDLTIDRKTGFVFGTPYSIPVLDDIRALRRLEELVELVTHKWLFPLFHYTVGTEEEPAGVIELPDGTSMEEVDIVRAQVQSMPTEGGMITPHRHQIELIGAEGQVLDITAYIEHFKIRVMSGLRLSGIDVGQGDTANRGTATTMAKSMVDSVKDYQCVLSDHITTRLLDVLLLEGGFDVTPENRVTFVFPTPDREELRSHQNHGLTLFQSNAVTMDEFRREYLNREPMSQDELENDTFFGLFERPESELQANIALSKPAGGGSSSLSPGSKPTGSSGGGAGKLAKSLSTPSNQFGKMPTRPTIPANDYVNGIMNLWSDFKNEVIASPGKIKDASATFEDCAIYTGKRHIHRATDEGLEKAKQDSGNQDLSLCHEVYDVLMLKTLKNDLQKICHKLMILVKDKTSDPSGTSGVFGAVGIELRFMMRRHTQTAYRYGYAQACKQAGYDTIALENSDGETQDEIRLDNLTVRDMYAHLEPGYNLKVKGRIDG
jgi:hypothetical protein